MRRTMAALGVVALAATAACGGGGGDDGDGDGAGPPEPAEATTTTTTTTTAGPGLGDPHPKDGGTIVAHGYEQPVAPEAPEPGDDGHPDGHVWSALDVEVCVPAEPANYSVSRDLWALTMPDGSVVGPADADFAELPQPVYPKDLRVTEGQCTRGWITFAVPGDLRPTGAQYTPAEGEPISWPL